jgi:predicted nucleic acid-binding protein
MTLAEIPEASSVFIDANVFVYHFVGASVQCSTLLGRCETGEVRGMTSALVLAETAHRLMMIEAVERRLVTPGNVVRKLARRPAALRRLTVYASSIQAIPSMGVETLPLTEETIRLGLWHQRRHGLLTNDALIAATMTQRGLRLLATGDRRLTMVDDLDIASPTDLLPS